MPARSLGVTSQSVFQKGFWGRNVSPPCELDHRLRIIVARGLRARARRPRPESRQEKEMMLLVLPIA